MDKRKKIGAASRGLMAKTAFLPKKRFLISALAISLFLSACGDEIGDKYVSFAQCLTDKGVKMYGAYWCPHCASQKKLFGARGFRKIDYIECDPRGVGGNPELCRAKNVTGYPTWEFGGKTDPGEKTLEELSKKTGCELPPDGGNSDAAAEPGAKSETTTK